MIMESVLRKNLKNYFRVREASGNELLFETQWIAECQAMVLKHHEKNLKIEFRFTIVPDFVVVHAKIESHTNTTLTMEYDQPQLLVCYQLGHQTNFPDGSTMLPLQYNTAFFPEQRCEMEIAKCRNYEFVLIRFPVVAMREWPDNDEFATFCEKVLQRQPAILWPEHLVIMPRTLRLIRDLIMPDRTLPHNALLHLRCTQLLVMMLEQVAQEITEPTAHLDRDTVQKVQAIREFMLENISRKISRTMLLREVGSGPKKIQEGFRALYGKGMFDVLHEERMEHAWKWIREGQRSIGTISEDLGYKTQKHFSKVFKTYFGIKPSENRGHRIFDRQR